jgi:hypothetical protein
VGCRTVKKIIIIIIIITIITGGTALKVSWQFPLFVLVSLGLLQGKASGSEDGIMLGSAVFGVYCGGTKCGFWA